MNRAAAIEWGQRLNRAHLYAIVAEVREAPDYWISADPGRAYYLRWCGPLPLRSDWELASWDATQAFDMSAKSLQ